MNENGKEKKVTMHFTASLKNGEVLESTRDLDPVTLTLGKGALFRKLEDEMSSMREGERKTIEVPSSEAFGKYRNELVIAVPMEKFPGSVKIGERYLLKTTDEENIQVSIKEIGENTVVVDGNHPLAGEDLIFDIEIVKVA
ncbi:MAG: FKBP-type peptidyl-prolyl cis-trans isomerase [Spirochaetes bacterium]|nr:FKBP-type peptidyl-prolyl cis-trans isomerase [Spirochaetota bacterium]